MRVAPAAAAILLTAISVTACGGAEGSTRSAAADVSSTETIDDIPVDLSLLPEELQQLAPLIRRYAVGDDVERVERLERSSVGELRALQAATEPHWDAINEYLDVHLYTRPTPHQDVALVLSSSAEARVELEERGGA